MPFHGTRYVVRTSEAHDAGLCAADRETRKRFAQDLLNLTLASPVVNRHQKSGKDAGEWLPDRNRCWFSGRVLEVKRACRDDGVKAGPVNAHDTGSGAGSPSLLGSRFEEDDVDANLALARDPGDRRAVPRSRITEKWDHPGWTVATTGHPAIGVLMQLRGPTSQGFMYADTGGNWPPVVFQGKLVHALDLSATCSGCGVCEHIGWDREDLWMGRAC